MSAARVFARWMALLGCTAAAIAQTPSTAPAPISLAWGLAPYNVIKTIPVGGAGLSDRITVDAPARRLFIPRDSHITVLNADTGAAVGDIPSLQGVHGVALARELRRGFATNFRANTVTIFDLATLSPIATVKTETGPDSVVYDLVSKTVFAMSLHSHSITAINAINGRVRGTLRLTDSPSNAVADGRGNLYVSLADTAEIAVVDTESMSLRRRIPLAPCLEPRGMALDLERGTLYAGCSNQMMVVADATSGHLLATVPTGERTGSVAFDSDRQLAFAANGDGTLTVVHEDSLGQFSVVETLETRRGARAMALDGRTHRILLATAVSQSPAQIEEVGLMKRDSFVVLIAGK